MKKLVLVGGRGYTGAALLDLLAGHDGFELVAASSGSRAGTPLGAVAAAWRNRPEQFVSLSPGEVAGLAADVWVLALPNGHSAPWVAAIGAAHPEAVCLDLGGDHRCDAGWAYGLPELNRHALAGARRIANPGCYATAAQLALAPVAGLLGTTPTVFGVSGYSGAGRTPSPRNDPARVRDNLMPYQLSGHVHEREIGHRLSRPVRFHPHVAPFFRGLNVTVSAELAVPASVEGLVHCYRTAFDGEPLVQVTESIPEVGDVAGTHGAAVGGFDVDARDPRRITVVAALDNLNKGAAVQAMQNLNLACGLPEFTGIHVDPAASDAGRVSA